MQAAFSGLSGYMCLGVLAPVPFEQSLLIPCDGFVRPRDLIIGVCCI